MIGYIRVPTRRERGGDQFVRKKCLSGGHALTRDFAPAMRNLFPHFLLGLLLRTRGPFVGQRGPRENPLLRDAFSRLHGTRLPRRAGRRRMNLPVIVTAQRQIRNIHFWLADGPLYSATTVSAGHLSSLSSSAPAACSPITLRSVTKSRRRRQGLQVSGLRPRAGRAPYPRRQIAGEASPRWSRRLCSRPPTNPAPACVSH